MLAERFAEDEGGVSTVILASGESQVDAVTAAGLAGNLNAPVMLTRSSRLPHNVARFIDEQNVTDVVVVGGAAAVSDDVVTAIESLGSRPSVERVSGADRYATAAAIGNKLGGPNPTWCGSDQSAAILVNGGDAGRADAVISGPLAFRLGLPVLLTAADMVPEATAAFLTDNKVERVVVVGGMSAVSGDVVDALVEDIGVVNVQRISGGSAAATSVMVANEMLGNCADVLQTNRDMVALVNRDAIADGIAAAPVLGRGLGDSGSVPIMLVGDELPAAVNDYLAGTAETRGGNKTHQRIVAIGGTAVVSNAVMADAVAAAKTSSMLTATIAPHKYGPTEGAAAAAAGKSVGDYKTSFSVTFSDDVKEPGDADGDATPNNSTVDRANTVLDPTLYRVNGRRLQALSTDGESGTVPDLIFKANRTVTIVLSHHLEAGDTIVVDATLLERDGMRLGDNLDRRKLETASLTLGAVTIAADRSAPRIEIVAVLGQRTIDVLVTEPAATILHDELAGSNATDFVSIQAATRAAAIDVTGVTAEDADTDPVGSKAFGRAGVTRRYSVAVDRALVRGDVITVHRSAVIDNGGRRSALTRHTVVPSKNNIAVGTTKDGVAGTGDFVIQSVSIGDYDHGTATAGQASATITSVDDTGQMTVTAKHTGVASGARGNAWRIFGYDDRPAGSTNVFDIRVAVDIANQRISYTISETQPVRPLPTGVAGATLGDLASALVSNSDFAANFGVSYVDPVPATGKDTPLGATSSAGQGFSAGQTKVGVVVRFNDNAATVTADALAAAIAPRLSNTALSLADPRDAGVAVVSHFTPDSAVHISYSADSMAQLPTRSGFRVIPADVAFGHDATGAARSGAGDGNIRAILNSLRPDASIKP